MSMSMYSFKIVQLYLFHCVFKIIMSEEDQEDLNELAKHFNIHT